MKRSRFIRECFALLSLLALSGGAIINEAHADTAYWYKGPWVIYEDSGHVHILVETNPGVNDSVTHRNLNFTWGDGCNEPNWGYSYETITAGKKRRLWTMWVDNLSPDCCYSYTFKFRLTVGDLLWSKVSGSFVTPPSGVPDEGFFCALGDQRYIDTNSKDPINHVAEAMLFNEDPRYFVINTGDLVYQGGYSFNDHDNWWHYFRLDDVRDLFADMPTFPTPGNHDVDYGHHEANVDAWNYTRYFPYSEVTHDARKAYYYRRYGLFHVFSLTSFPMDKDQYCSNTNANYRPKDKGGTGQYEWLENKLIEIQDDPHPWKIVFMHAPMYSPQDCNNQWDAKNYLKPLFEKYGVDIFFAGHEHYYARKTVNGIPYLILGGGGAGLGLDKPECITDPQSCNGFEVVLNKYNFADVSTKGDVMNVCVWCNNDSSLKVEDWGTYDIFNVDRTPKADFDVDHETAAVDSPVKFEDKSTGHRYQYTWDFGDGTTHEGTGTDASVEHSYSEVGIYTVTLTIKSAYNTDTKTRTACVTVGPKADFEGTPMEGAPPLEVSFEDESKGAVSNWEWDFGDGNTSSEQNPVHTYQENGRHTVSLKVSNDGVSNTKTEHDYIKVDPYAEFNYKMSMYCTFRDPITQQCEMADYPTTFYNASRGSGLKYLWDFGDGNTSSVENPTHDYADPGFTTKLTVTDGTGLTDYMTKYIEVGSGQSPENIRVNIMPEDDSNLIVISDTGRFWPEVIPVAILSDASFDASGLDTDTISFGRTGNEASLVDCDTALRDVNGDGYRDLVCRFEAIQTDLRVGDDKGILRGVIVTDWGLMEGEDGVQLEKFPIHR